MNKRKKTALVTGASKGIGRSIAQRLIEQGYFIYGTFNTENDQIKELKKQFVDLEFFQCNFADRNQILRLLDKLKHIDFDIIINNAGIIKFENYENLTIEAWDEILNINLTAPFLLCHELRGNIKTNGSIINICSTDGLTGSFNSIPYSVSKAGLLNLTKSLANVFGEKNVRVNSVSPRWVGSGMNSPALETALKMTPLKRLASYDEIAEVVLFLASEKAGFINGENIIIDGGYANVDSIMKRESELT